MLREAAVAVTAAQTDGRDHLDPVFDLVPRQPLVEQIDQRHAGARRRGVRDLPPERVPELDRRVLVIAEPVSITCLPVTGSCPPKIRTW
ncbi:MAG: hypothetical protein M3R63_21170 [Actinomycetota bacterium]|nr:hypothetical protein [Actinomycetota bacterium]